MDGEVGLHPSFLKNMEELPHYPTDFEKNHDGETIKQENEIEIDIKFENPDGSYLLDSVVCEDENNAKPNPESSRPVPKQNKPRKTRSKKQNATDNPLPIENCDICFKPYRNSQALKKHVERVHLKVAHYICPTCGKGFYHNHVLKSHVEGAHSNVKYACSSCGRWMSSKTSLLIHEVIVCKLYGEELEAGKLGVVFKKCTHPGCDKVVHGSGKLRIHLRNHEIWNK